MLGATGLPDRMLPRAPLLWGEELNLGLKKKKIGGGKEMSVCLPMHKLFGRPAYCKFVLDECAKSSFPIIYFL